MKRVVDDRFTLYVCDVLQGLRQLDDESIHTCVTSPPYWGLRNYATEPQTWGGDSQCVHVFTERRYYVEGGGGAESSSEAFSEAGIENADRLRNARWREDATCGRCGAWRGHLGLEATPQQFVRHLTTIFREVHRVLRSDGTLWVNLGDSYAASGPRDRAGSRESGLKRKDLAGVPWRLAFALQDDGWYLRSDIIWAKTNPLPESVRDRPTRSHEYLFLLTKSQRYFYDADAIREPHAEMTRPQSEKRRQQRMSRAVASVNGRGQSSKGIDDGLVATEHVMRTNPEGRNKRSVWTISTQSYKGAHFATFPEALAEQCILAGTSEAGCCPECGGSWKRLVETGETTYARLSADTSWRTMQSAARERGSALKAGADAAGQTRNANGTSPHLGSAERRTVGWEPACDHGRVAVPCTVLDPFTGSATTAQVARAHGRRSVGIELNPDYAELAVARFHSPTRAEKQRGTGRNRNQAPVTSSEQISLFSGEAG